LTVLTTRLDVTGEEELTLDGVSVVNGCQSLVALYKQSDTITDDLRVLCKIVQVPLHSGLADKITYRANNQNPVDIRDQRATDPVQRQLQAEVEELYPGTFGLAIREGEKVEAEHVMSNKEAAQLIMAVYVKQPWNAVRKVRLFDHDYTRIFNHTIDAPKLYLLHVISEVVAGARAELKPSLRASFASIRLALAFLLSEVLQQTEQGSGLLESPQAWLPHQEIDVRQRLKMLMADIVESVNFYLDDKEGDGDTPPDDEFDPKVAFKSRAGVLEIARDVIGYSKRQARRDQDYFFNLEPDDA
jgi:hypothetical protein